MSDRRPSCLARALGAIAPPVLALALASCVSTSEPPRTLAGLTRTRVAAGDSALAEVRMLHGGALALEWAAVAEYGGGRATLWVAGVPDADAALADMTARIARGRSPFRPSGERALHGRRVWLLEGLGQRHAYFGAGDRVVWVALDRSRADRVLEAALRAYR